MSVESDLCVFACHPSHIMEHLQNVIATKTKDQMTEEELEFHYFKQHDYDGNNKLDGVEIGKALTHFHDGQFSLICTLLSLLLWLTYSYIKFCDCSCEYDWLSGWLIWVVQSLMYYIFFHMKVEGWTSAMGGCSKFDPSVKIWYLVLGKATRRVNYTSLRCKQWLSVHWEKSRISSESFFPWKWCHTRAHRWLNKRKKKSLITWSFFSLQRKIFT